MQSYRLTSKTSKDDRERENGDHNKGSAPRRFYRKTARVKTAFAVSVTVNL